MNAAFKAKLEGREPHKCSRPYYCMAQTRFIADAMLGRLARWLRMLGFDTLYDPDADDPTIMRIARAEDRVILTRDSDFQRPGVGPCVFVRSDHVEEQLVQVISERGLHYPGGQRCPECNGGLREVSRKDIIDSVPAYVYHTIDRFHQCSDCGRVYWEGTHLRNFKETVKRLLHDEEKS